MSLRPKVDAAVLATCDGYVMIVSLNKDRGLTEKEYRKAEKWLRRADFIREGYFDPFPEYERYSNLKINRRNLQIIDGNLLGVV